MSGSRRIPPSLVATALDLLLAGCGGNAAASAPTQGPAYATAGWVHVMVVFNPSPPTALRWVTVEVKLRGPRGGPLAGGHAGMRLQMLAMAGMPVPQPQLQASGPGVLSGRVLFVMGGAWQAVVSVRDGARHVRVTLPVEVRP